MLGIVSKEDVGPCYSLRRGDARVRSSFGCSAAFQRAAHCALLGSGPWSRTIVLAPLADPPLLTLHLKDMLNRRPNNEEHDNDMAEKYSEMTEVLKHSTSTMDIPLRTMQLIVAA